MLNNRYTNIHHSVKTYFYDTECAPLVLFRLTIACTYVYTHIHIHTYTSSSMGIYKSLNTSELLENINSIPQAKLHFTISINGLEYNPEMINVLSVITQTEEQSLPPQIKNVSSVPLTN